MWNCKVMLDWLNVSWICTEVTFFTEFTKITRLRDGRSEVRIPTGAGDFFFSEMSRQALSSTKHPFQYAPVVFPGGQCGRGVKLTTHLHLPPRLSKRGFPVLLINNLTHFFQCIYLFHFSTCFEQHSAHHQENQLYQYIIWYISLCEGDWLVCRSLRTGIPDSHVHTVIHTRWCIDTIYSPDDEHCVARNM
jgi:hypothetical protein